MCHFLIFSDFRFQCAVPVGGEGHWKGKCKNSAKNYKLAITIEEHNKMGGLGAVMGMQVAITNRLLNTNSAYIVKPGALALFMKRDTLVEFDRDKIDQTNYIIASKIFAPYLYDETKIIKCVLQ